MNEVPLIAWTFDPRFRVLSGWSRIEPIVNSASGERIYRVPPNATLVVPPAPCPPKKAFVFAEYGKWILLADHRGEQWFDEKDHPVTVERLGDPEVWGWNREPVMRSAPGRLSARSCGL